jgi:hypothetical protein
MIAMWRWRDGTSNLELAARDRDVGVRGQDGRVVARIASGSRADVELGPDVRYLTWTDSP